MRYVGEFLPASLKLPTEQWQLGYLAATVDAEGTLSWGRRHTWARQSITITNTDQQLLDWLAAIGGRTYRNSPAPLSKLPCFRWVVTRRADVILLLEALLPYMLTKQQRAAQMLSDLRAIPKDHWLGKRRMKGDPFSWYTITEEKAGRFVTPTGQ